MHSCTIAQEPAGEKKNELDEKSFRNVDRNLSSHLRNAAHDLLLVSHQADADVDELLQRHLCDVVEAVVAGKSEILRVSTHLDGVEPVVDAGEGGVVRQVVGERIVHRTLGDLLQRLWTANLEKEQVQLKPGYNLFIIIISSRTTRPDMSQNDTMGSCV